MIFKFKRHNPNQYTNFKYPKEPQHFSKSKPDHHIILLGGTWIEIIIEMYPRCLPTPWWCCALSQLPKSYWVGPFRSQENDLGMLGCSFSNNLKVGVTKLIFLLSQKPKTQISVDRSNLGVFSMIDFVELVSIFKCRRIVQKIYKACDLFYINGKVRSTVLTYWFVKVHY